MANNPASLVAAQAAELATDENVSAFVDHIGNRKCEACGDNVWHNLASSGKIPQLMEVGNLDNGLAVLPLLCGSCGNMRFFAWSRFVHFMEAEKKANVSS